MDFVEVITPGTGCLLIEVCVDSIESARQAVEASADRLEVCGNLASGGGTTPSPGLVQGIIELFPHTPVMVMIRPRVGDFVYSNDELSIMKLDIQIFKSMGIKGFVFGALNIDGTVDKFEGNDLTPYSLVQEAQPLEGRLSFFGPYLTFHRAFDMSNDLLQAFHAIEGIKGITRILTSGGEPGAISGKQTLKGLMTLSEDIIIIPGSGINHQTIKDIFPIFRTDRPREIHMSGGDWVDGNSKHPPKVGMGMSISDNHATQIWRTSGYNIKAVRDIVSFLEANE